MAFSVIFQRLAVKHGTFLHVVGAKKLSHEQLVAITRCSLRHPGGGRQVNCIAIKIQQGKALGDHVTGLPVTIFHHHLWSGRCH